MHAKHILAASAIALVASVSFADDITVDKIPSGSTLTRAQVKASVLQARASGQLLPAGEGYNGIPVPTTSNLARSEVKREVLSARASGQLLPAGESDQQAVAELAAPSTLSRADVKAEVLAARKTGDLLPAGERYAGYGDEAIKSVPGKNPLAALANVLHAKRHSETVAQ